MEKPYHNKGLFSSFTIIVLVFFVLPVILTLNIDDTWDRFKVKYFPNSECWETSKHERVCRGDNKCTLWRNFCHE